MGKIFVFYFRVQHWFWNTSYTYMRIFIQTGFPVYWVIQGGAEPTDTFKMVIWRKGKISETVYKYVQVCYLLPTDYKRIFWTSGRWPLFISMHCCKRVWKLPYTRLRRSSSIAVTSSTMACLSSWIVMIRLRNTRSFRNPHRKKSGTVRSGDRAGQAMSPKLRTQVTRCCTFQRSIATDHMKWRPLLYRSPSRQPWRAQKWLWLLLYIMRNCCILTRFRVVCVALQRWN